MPTILPVLEFVIGVLVGVENLFSGHFQSMLVVKL